MDISKNIHQEIRLWQKSTNQITEEWIVEYFELSEEDSASGIDYYWVANDVGTVFEFADYFFDFNTVLKCYELGINKEQLFTWYDFCLDSHPVNISLAKYILSPEEIKEAEEKHLEELKDRVRSAEETFKKALEEYGK